MTTVRYLDRIRCRGYEPLMQQEVLSAVSQVHVAHVRSCFPENAPQELSLRTIHPIKSSYGDAVRLFYEEESVVAEHEIQKLRNSLVKYLDGLLEHNPFPIEALKAEVNETLQCLYRRGRGVLFFNFFEFCEELSDEKFQDSCKSFIELILSDFHLNCPHSLLPLGFLLRTQFEGYNSYNPDSHPFSTRFIHLLKILALLGISDAQAVLARLVFLRIHNTREDRSNSQMPDPIDELTFLADSGSIKAQNYLVRHLELGYHPSEELRKQAFFKIIIEKKAIGSSSIASALARNALENGCSLDLDWRTRKSLLEERMEAGDEWSAKMLLDIYERNEFQELTPEEKASGIERIKQTRHPRALKCLAHTIHRRPASQISLEEKIRELEQLAISCGSVDASRLLIKYYYSAAAGYDQYEQMDLSLKLAVKGSWHAAKHVLSLLLIGEYSQKQQIYILRDLSLAFPKEDFWRNLRPFIPSDRYKDLAFVFNVLKALSK